MRGASSFLSLGCRPNLNDPPTAVGGYSRERKSTYLLEMLRRVLSNTKPGGNEFGGIRGF